MIFFLNWNLIEFIVIYIVCYPCRRGRIGKTTKTKYYTKTESIVSPLQRTQSLDSHQPSGVTTTNKSNLLAILNNSNSDKQRVNQDRKQTIFNSPKSLVYENQKRLLDEYRNGAE